MLTLQSTVSNGSTGMLAVVKDLNNEYALGPSARITKKL
jgi:hypothetical protein